MAPPLQTPLAELLAMLAALSGLKKPAEGICRPTKAVVV